MRGWVRPNRRDVRDTVRLVLMVGLHRRSWIHEGSSRGRTDEEQVWRGVGAIRDESQILVRSGSRINLRERRSGP